jgi:short-subunit dehydrogenase
MTALEGKTAVITGGSSGIGTNVIAVMSDVSRLSDLDLLYKEVAEKTGNIYA